MTQEIAIDAITRLYRLLRMEVIIKKLDNNSITKRSFIHGHDFLRNYIRHFKAFVLPGCVKEISVASDFSNGVSDHKHPPYVNERLSYYYLEGLKYRSMTYQVLSALISKNPRNHRVDLYKIITSSLKNLNSEESQQQKRIIEHGKFSVEIERIIRSFYPCIFCGTHYITSKKEIEFQRV